MKSNYDTVKQGTKRLPFLQLASKARNSVRMMTGNPHFPMPNPGFAAVLEACDELEIATRVFEFTRGRQDMMRRDEACTHLRMLLRGLGGYVQNVSRGDAAIIQSAGFETKRKVQPSAPLAAPERVVAVRTEYPGTLVVRWGGVKNRKCYEVQVNGGDPTDASAWCTLTFTGQNQVRAEGLESQRQYYFRVIAFGAKGCSPVSDIAMAKAA